MPKIIKLLQGKVNKIKNHVFRLNMKNPTQEFMISKREIAEYIGRISKHFNYLHFLSSILKNDYNIIDALYYLGMIS